MKSDLVKNWMGDRFSRLHPLLQKLHESGGCLRGPVEIRTGAGLAGWLGRQLAAKMGVPLIGGPFDLQVDIRHHGATLLWSRQFIQQNGTTHKLDSVFEAVGRWPRGHWVEQTGALKFKLTVDVLDGAWHWRVLGVSLHGCPVPAALLPKSRAYKQVENNAYRFEVAFVAPWLGELFSYRGLLEWVPIQTGEAPMAIFASPASNPHP